MCGRYFLATLPEQLAAYFDIKGHKYPLYAASYNIAPTQLAPVVRVDDEGDLSIDLLRWGLIPAWARDTRIASQTINARAESVADKPSFRQAYRKRRCLVPQSGYYEWIGDTRQKQPYAVIPQSDELFVAAGIWESWRGPDQVAIETFSILTCAASDEIAPLHDRMPVLLAPSDWRFWLEAPAAALDPLLKSAPGGTAKWFPVDRAVGSPKNNHAGLIDPIDAPAPLRLGHLFDS
ncbi:MAG: SOS response-associated peptidase [Ahniella sp.]|nr:SOS response-associated peptidase [Ahniella sp.]